MLHDFFNVDKSPVVALTVKSLSKTKLAVMVGMISISVGTGLLPLTVAGVSNTQVASAQIASASVDANSIIGNYWQRFEAGRWRQTYFGTIGPSYSAYLQQNWGVSAPARAHYLCTSYIINRTGVNIWDSAWFFVAVQYNGDRYNCYYRKRV
jgi:hypothetical protein